MLHERGLYLHLLLSIFLGQQFLVGCKGDVWCTDDDYCERVFREGSKCDLRKGICTNPFHYGGCLQSYMAENDDGWVRHPRVCGSDDPVEAVQLGYCHPPPIEHYMEVRIASENWESAFFHAWILQIVLTEILGVPASIETGLPGLNMDFYNMHSSFDYGSNNDWAALDRSTEIRDCRMLSNITDDEEEGAYLSCAHVIPEVWSENIHMLDELYKGGIIEGPMEMGALGGQNWFVPRFTAERDPTLLSYTGLRGGMNRRKLAETFKRPTTWKEYCDEVSESNCVNDTTAVRYPKFEAESNSYYVEGLYVGYFRPTSKNDCDRFPARCTGHITDFPCGWASFVKQQTHHLDIALESDGPDTSNGYSYSQMTQIWAAANATKSDVMMLWWSPESLYQKYVGTDAEFTRVVLPPPTQECEDARVKPEDRCLSHEPAAIFGSPLGACDSSPRSLQKVISRGLYDGAFDQHIPEVLRSPSYEFIQSFRIDELQIGQIFRYWNERGTDQLNFDPRDATCRWVVENFDLVQSFVPTTYPRTIVEIDRASSPLQAISIAISTTAMGIVILSGLVAYIQRKQWAIRMAQGDVLLLMMTGWLLIATSALFMSLSPTDVTCISGTWLLNIGYTVALAAIAFKTLAIHRHIAAGKGMQKLVIVRRNIFGAVVSAGFFDSVALLCWTLSDAPIPRDSHHLTDELTPEGETVVELSFYCGSTSMKWENITVAWRLLLLTVATVLTFMTRRTRIYRNDLEALSSLVYAHLLFIVVGRVVVVALEESINESQMMMSQSLIFSMYCITSVAVYLLPKLFAASDKEDTEEQLPDLFLNTTIMFADLAGFTAWSSMKEPSQVFKFLETLYSEFDDIAEARQVFKVETVGDCYGKYINRFRPEISKSFCSSHGSYRLLLHP